MSTLLQDARYALRTLGRSRTYTIVAVLCLALGIGLNTAVFSIVNTVLLRPFPFHEAERVVSIHAADPQRGIAQSPLSAADFADWTSGATTLAETAAIVEDVFVLSARGEESERVQGLEVTPNLFRMLGIRPALGRDFVEAEGEPGAARVAIVSHALWQRRYGGDPAIVGRVVDVDGTPHTVVGVMPEGMRFPETALMWVPTVLDPTESRGSRYLWGMGRLAAGASAGQAQAELDATARLLASEHPRTNAGLRARVMTFQDYMVDGPLRLLLVLMLAAVGCVLLIACANVANLLLARAAARGREIAVRAALGAGRGRLVRQLLTESVLVALAGGGLGVLVALWFTDAMLASIPEELPYWFRVEIDVAALGYTVLVSTVTGLLFGVVPALRASRADLQQTLREGGRGAAGGSGARLRGALVSAQIALSLVLLVSASLMVRSFLAVNDADPGFDTRPIMTARTFLAGERYDDPASRAQYFALGVERLAQVPGVLAAAATSAIPTDDGGSRVAVVQEGNPLPVGQEPLVSVIGSTPELFDALGLELRAGRRFTAVEAADPQAEVAIVNRALAEQLWPGADPVGRRIRLPMVDSVAWLTVVGVAPDIVYEEFGEEDAVSRRQVHLPYARLPRRYMGFIVRSERPAEYVSSAVRQTLRGLDTTLPTFDVRTMDEVRRFTTWNYALYGRIFTVFGAIALVLASVGIYGVVSYAVAQRTREIGVRLALGADPAEVRRMVLRQGARLAGVGVGVGLLAAVAAARGLSGLLYGVEPGDPVSFGVVALVLATVALLACWVPAHRATRIDPLDALRSE